MKIIDSLTKQQEEQLNVSIQSAIEFINAYKQAPDTQRLKDCLCKVVDGMPNVAYLEPDVLSCYDIEADESNWVECTEEEQKYSNESLKKIINDIEKFEPYQLSTMSSGSILRTIFGDAFDEMQRM